jgi:hypothetical protein
MTLGPCWTSSAVGSVLQATVRDGHTLESMVVQISPNNNGKQEINTHIYVVRQCAYIHGTNSDSFTINNLLQ